MKLKSFLSQHRISRDAFAKMIGTSQVAVTRYVAGTRTPRPEVMVRIKEATGGAVTADDFMPGEEAAA